MSKTSDISSATSDMSAEKAYPIELCYISRYYTLGKSIVKALDGIDLAIEAGQFVCVMGPSGSGKTTLLNVIAGLDQPTGGEVRLLSKNLSALSDEGKCEVRRHNVGYVFQFFNLHPTLTAIENIELPQLIAGVSYGTRRVRAEELLELVGLQKRANHLPHELSGGEKQRVGIARALANDPPIILADEPTGDMDHVMGAEILQLLESLNTDLGKTMVMVTHDESMIKKGMRLLRLLDGKILSDQIVKEDLEPSRYWDYSSSQTDES